MSLPARFADLKRAIVPTETEARLTESWNDLLQELAKFAKEVEKNGSNVIPVIDFKDLANPTPELQERIKKCGTVVIRNLVNPEVCLEWKDSLREYVKNTDVQGFPEQNKQFFHLYWSAPQVQARSNPNILEASVFLNSLWHTSGSDVTLASLGVDPKQPLSYADRFRLRAPGPSKWDAHPPHIDGGSIERWEDEYYRAFYNQVLSGNWRQHDPFLLDNKIKSNSNLYRSTSSTIFRTFQGWLALSDTGPGEGTLQVFPNVLLSNAYTILRPFFRPVEPPVSNDPLAPENWVFDVSSPDFPGIFPHQTWYSGPKFADKTHPHMKLATTMVSVPKVKPGDMVFWHCDVVHGVEEEHRGAGDSSVMYIPAMPTTDENRRYILEQNKTFMRGEAPPDFATTQITPERDYKGCGKLEDVQAAGRQPMGFVA